MDDEFVATKGFPEANCSAGELVSFLKGSFLRTDFEKAANILKMREVESGKKEASLKAELQKVAEESKLKDERIRELEEKNEEAARREKERERELQSLFVRNRELEDECGKWELECTAARMQIDLLMRKGEEAEVRFRDLESAFAELGIEKQMVEEELEDWKRKCNKLEEDFPVVRGEMEKMKEQIKGLLEELGKKRESSKHHTEAELKFDEVDSTNQQPPLLSPAFKIDTSSNRQPCAPNLVPKTETPIDRLIIEKKHSTAAGGPHKLVIDISDSDEEVDASSAPPPTSSSRKSGTLNISSDNMVKSLLQGAPTNLTEKTPNSSLKIPTSETRIVASDSNIISSTERRILSPKIKLLSEVVAVDDNGEGTRRVTGRAANTCGLGDLVQTSQLTSSSLTETTSKMSSNDKNYSIEVKKNVGPGEEDDRILSPKRRRLSKVISDGESDEDEDNQNSTRRTKKLLVDLLAGNEHGKLNSDPAALVGGQRLVDTPQNKDSVQTSRLLMEVDTAGCSEEISTFKNPVTPTRKRIHLLRELEKMTDTKEISSVVPADEGDAKNVKSTLSRAAGEFILENLHNENNAIESSESESLGGFIVNGAGESEAESSSSDSSACGADDGSSSQDSLTHILGRIRKKKSSENWEFEADMLASFQKDDELCMKAVCALYRQQTSEEKAGKASLYHNRRGFNKFDALRGSELAEFLTDGDPFGPLKKSAKELERHKPEGVEYCRELAMRYSKQLFEIYQKQEDPFFCPSS
ncbi:hypothetical protein EJ110_NYTH54555 [Nymphaea thermarum]|nr:hypothetical protein EJ110_NYTH54555 [Nymphaea thermarum]